MRSRPSASRRTEPAWVAIASTSPPAVAAVVQPSAREVPAGRASLMASRASGIPSRAPTVAMATDSPATMRTTWGIEAPRNLNNAISRRRRSERSATTISCRASRRGCSRATQLGQRRGPLRGHADGLAHRRDGRRRWQRLCQTYMVEIELIRSRARKRMRFRLAAAQAPAAHCAAQSSG